jgi:hypothetical protein
MARPPWDIDIVEHSRRRIRPARTAGHSKRRDRGGRQKRLQEVRRASFGEHEARELR